MYNDLVDRKLSFGLNLIGLGRNKKELKIDISKVMIYWNKAVSIAVWTDIDM